MAIRERYRRVGRDFPGMGGHWIRVRLVFDGEFDASRPEVLNDITVTLPPWRDPARAWRDARLDLVVRSEGGVHSLWTGLLSHPGSAVDLCDAFERRRRCG